MKKIFTLFAAMLMTLALNAAIDAGEDVLSAEIAKVSPGATATIELNSGNYTETAAIEISDMNLTIKAANMENKPVLKKIQFTISGAATVKFLGIDMDANGITGDVISVGDNSANSLELDGCEIYTMGSHSAIKIEGGNHLDLLKVNNCYFHDANASAIDAEKHATINACSRMEVKNSTFVNFINFNYPVIMLWSGNDNFAANQEDDPVLIVDHCTFYNIFKTDSGSTYAFVDSRRSKNVTISNNIFVNPSTIPTGNYKPKATQIYSGSISNNLRYGQVSSHRTGSGISITGEITQDPLFTNAASGNFTLSESSPAIGAGTDGKTLGDQRWWPAITYPETDFKDNEGAGYYCLADDAALVGGGSGNFTLVKSEEPHYIKWSDVAKAQAGTASWTITATSACFIKVKLDLGHKVGTNWHMYEVQLWDESGNKIDTISEGLAAWDDTYQNNDSMQIKTLDGYLIVPAPGDYTIKLLNTRDYGKGAVKKVILQYMQDIPTIQMKGSWDSWLAPRDLTLSDDGQTASVTISLNSDSEPEFKILVNGAWRANGWHFYRTTSPTNENLDSDGNNMKIRTDWDGDYTITWKLKTNTLGVAFPEVPVPVFYVMGDFNSWDVLGNMAEMTEVEGVCTASVHLPATTTTKFKILKVDAWGNWTRYGAENAVNSMTYESCTNWQLTTTNGGNDINLTTTIEMDYLFTFYAGTAKLSVDIPDPSTTAIDNTVVSEKAVKVIRNGQLFIEKDGKTYNVLGTVVK